MRGWAADTWHSLVAMTDAKTGLPADNINEGLTVADRSGYTSPTNIGGYLSASILGGPSTTMIGNIIQTQYVNNADYPIASALALILMVTLMLAMAIYARVFGTRTLQEHVT